MIYAKFAGRPCLKEKPSMIIIQFHIAMADQLRLRTGVSFTLHAIQGADQWMNPAIRNLAFFGADSK